MVKLTNYFLHLTFKHPVVFLNFKKMIENTYFNPFYPPFPYQDEEINEVQMYAIAIFLCILGGKRSEASIFHIIGLFLPHRRNPEEDRRVPRSLTGAALEPEMRRPRPQPLLGSIITFSPISSGKIRSIRPQ